jgi:hypothetical protein
VLHTRETDGTVTAGAFPEAGLIFDSNGALYGAMSTEGAMGASRGVHKRDRASWGDRALF